MITTYLRLDLFHGDDNGKLRLLRFDSFDLNINENLLDNLQGADNANYAELVLVSEFGYNRDVSLVARFRRAKIKGKRDYQWILTKER